MDDYADFRGLCAIFHAAKVMDQWPTIPPDSLRDLLAVAFTYHHPSAVARANADAAAIRLGLTKGVCDDSGSIQ